MMPAEVPCQSARRPLAATMPRAASRTLAKDDAGSWSVMLARTIGWLIT